jgi:hypothetical protein
MSATQVSSAAEQSAILAFWAWFQSNESELLGLDAIDEAKRDFVFDGLMQQLTKIHPDMTFELGPAEEGVRPLIISAGGIREAFSAVENTVLRAPELANWDVIAFRPRQAAGTVLQLDDAKFDPVDVLVEMFEDEGKIGLALYLPGVTADDDEETLNFYRQAAYLLLDMSLGEYDVETKVGFIDLQPMPAETPEMAFPMDELAEEFDAAWADMKPH